MSHHIKGKAKRHFFLAVEIPPHIAAEINKVQSHLPDTWRAKATYDYHCTLAYFGGVEDDRLDDLKDEIAKIKYAPFSLNVSGFDCFNRTNTGQKDHVLFAKFNDAAQSEIKTLHGRVMAPLRLQKFPIGRLDIHPHITIRKVPKCEQDETTMINFIRSNEGFRTQPWVADHMVLYESLPHKMRKIGQSTYFEECKIPLSIA